MARKRKIWLSYPVISDAALHLCNIAGNQDNQNMIFTLAEALQIYLLKKDVEMFLRNHKEVELEGFYESTGATYYIALSLESKFEYLIAELEFLGYKKLHNSPNTCYEKKNLKKRYEELVTKAKKYTNFFDKI